MNYEQKYKEALERAKQIQSTPYTAHWDKMKELVEHIFPELKESEEDRIRKALMQNLKERFGTKGSMGKGLDMPDVLAWLKKQGEQKPADLKTKAGNWYACNMEVVNENMVTAFHRDEVYYCPKDGYIDVGGALFEVGSLDIFRLAKRKKFRSQNKNGVRRMKGNGIIYGMC